MAYSGNGPTLEPPRDKSRTENETARIKSMTQDIRGAQARIARLAAQLGYYGPPQTSPGSPAATPDPTNLVDCLSELRDEINALGGLLNVFD